MSQKHLPPLTMLNVQKVTTENIINFKDKVLDKYSNHKKGEWAFYTNKMVNDIISY
jgi:hypothetical protein